MTSASPKAMEGRTVASVEQANGYVVVRFDDGSTLYADTPAYYAPQLKPHRPARASHLGYAVPADAEEQFSCRV